MEKPVIGPEGQVCDSKETLDKALESYSHLSFNLFKGGATGKYSGETLVCECRYDPETDNPSAACGDSSGCINRELNIECESNTCPTGPFCQNQKFQLKQYAPVEIFQTDKKGLGLRAKSNLKRGSFVIEYCGEVLTSNNFRKRCMEYDKSGIKHFYFMSLKANEYIDATKRGNVSRFMNHSCNPNCQLLKWVVGSTHRVGMFVTSDVAQGTELTFDYKFERYGAEAQPCYCGENACTGFIGGNQKQSQMSFDQVSDDENMASDSDQEMDNSKSEPISNLQDGLQTVTDVQDLCKSLLHSTSNAKRVLVKVNIILKTDSVAILRKFVSYHGLLVLKSCLAAHIDSKTIVRRQILEVLRTLPISNRNTVVLLEPLIQKMTDEKAYGYEISQIAQELLGAWSELQMVYKIPKKAQNQVQKEEEERALKERQQAALEIKLAKEKEEEENRQREEKYEQEKKKRTEWPKRIPVYSNKPLLDGWQEFETPSGKLYYFNPVTQETRWDAPLKPTAQVKPVFQGVSLDLVNAKIEAAAESVRLQKLEQEEQEKKKAERRAEKKRKRLAEKIQQETKSKDLKKHDGEKRVRHEKKSAKHEKKKANDPKAVKMADHDAKSADRMQVDPISEIDKRDRKSTDNQDGKSKREKFKESRALMDQNLVTKWTALQEKTMKSSISEIVIKQLSKFKDQIDSEKFKEMAKGITKSLLDKEMRKHDGVDQVTDTYRIAFKKWIRSYLEGKGYKSAEK